MECFSRSLCFIFGGVFCLVALSGSVAGIGAQSGFSQEENYAYVEENWNGSIEIDFDEYWKGENKWGGYHIVYPVQINTEELIDKGLMREDCSDIRVASEGQLLGTRVQDNTCDTSETWVYFGNPDMEDGLKFDENESIEDIEVFYGNKEAGLSKYTTSVYNDDIATVLKPESALGMYYGHHTSVYVNDQTNLDSNDKNAPSQTWSVDFETDHGDTGTDYIHISDDDGNSQTFNSGDTYTIDSGNAPAWLQQGDTVYVYFKSQEVCYSGCDTATSNTKSAQWGNPVQFSNPDPAKSTGTSPVSTDSPNLQVDVTEPDGNSVTVNFYDADTGNLIGSDTVGSGSGTASVTWNGLSQGNTYRWYAEGCSTSCKNSATYEFDVSEISLYSPRPAISTGTSPVSTTSPDIETGVSEPDGNSVTVNFYDADSGNLIGSDTVGSGTGTASVSWSGLTETQTYRWYAEACSFSCKTGSTYEFDVNGFPEIDNIAVTNSTNNHQFTVRARVTDSDGDGDLSSCEVNATDQSGDSHIYNPAFTGVDGDNEAFCEQRITYSDDTYWDHLAELDVEVNVSDSKTWDASTVTNEFPNHLPNVNDITFTDYPAEHAFNVTGIISDVDSQNPNELANCEYEFSDNDGNTVTKTVPIDYSSGTNDQASCFYSSVNDSMPIGTSPGFEPTEDIDVRLEVEDVHTAGNNRVETRTLPNRPPTINVVSPKNGEPVITVDADLRVKLSDPEGDNIQTVEFRDDISGTMIGSTSNPASDTIQTWSDLDVGTYYWNVKAYDQWDSASETGIEFERTLGANYRVQHSIDYEYSSLIIEDNGQGFFFLETSIETDNRTVTTYLEGNNLNAVFMDSGSSQKTYEVEKDKPERFQIRVRSNDLGSHELKIITEDESVSSNTTVTFPIFVRESVSEQAEVPGLTLPYLALILALSSIVYMFYP